MMHWMKRTLLISLMKARLSHNGTTPRYSHHFLLFFVFDFLFQYHSVACPFCTRRSTATTVSIDGSSHILSVEIEVDVTQSRQFRFSDYIETDSRDEPSANWIMRLGVTNVADDAE